MGRPVQGPPHGARVPGGEPPGRHRPRHRRRDDVLDHGGPPEIAGHPETPHPEADRSPLVVAGGVVRHHLPPALARVGAGHGAAVGGRVDGPVRGGDLLERRRGARHGRRRQQDPQQLDAAREEGAADGPRHGPDRQGGDLVRWR